MVWLLVFVFVVILALLVLAWYISFERAVQDFIASGGATPTVDDPFRSYPHIVHYNVFVLPKVDERVIGLSSDTGPAQTGKDYGPHVFMNTFGVPVEDLIPKQRKQGYRFDGNKWVLVNVYDYVDEDWVPW